jgi:hypothetical protein
MIKKFRFLVGLLVFVTGSVVTLAASPVKPVQAAPADSTALYKIVPVESESTPIGCVNCPPQKISMPTFALQGNTENPTGFASKIDTFRTSVWNQKNNVNEAIEGYCSITFTKLMCLGDNRYGQLGDESYANSLSVPVEAKDKGIIINGVTDVSSNGFTTCIIASGELKCVGQGAWDGNYLKNYYTTDTTSTSTYKCINYSCSETESNRIQITSNLYELYDSSGARIEARTEIENCCIYHASKIWKTFTTFGNNVVKVKVGYQNGSTPTICVLLVDGTGKCSSVGKITEETINDETTQARVEEADCDNLPSIESRYEKKTSSWCSTSELNGTTSYDRHTTSTSGRKFSPAIWTWADAGVTGAVDMSVSDDGGSSSFICFAGTTTVCRKFSAGEFTTTTIVENGENSQAVYTPSGLGGGGLCIYSNGTISCGTGSYTQSGPVMASKVSTIAVMPQPLNIFYGSSGTMNKIFFLLPTGLLAADSWMLSCSNCMSNQQIVLSPVTAFQNSTSLQYMYAKTLNGSTDSMDYIPMTISTGVRKTRSLAILSVKTASGQALTGLGIRWTAPDMPGSLTSSASSTITTDSIGGARTTVVSGPVTFTLTSPGTANQIYSVLLSTPNAGSLASGATLQAASVTVIVPDSGDIFITVPDPPEIVSRKISVTLPDGSPVPSATVLLKNNYITYAYQNSGTSTSTWSSRPKDASGYLGQITCTYCFTTPPKYATGADGSVTFPSFNPTNRSSTYDADIAYDDGELNQVVKKNFTSITEVVQMPFMASIKATLPDADPSTPAKETDADPATPEPDIKPDADGAITIDSELLDEDNAPIAGLEQAVEVVTAGCDRGGLVAATAKVETLCQAGSVSTSSVNKSTILRAMDIRKMAACSILMASRSGANGKATLVVCPSTSTKYRIRGKGALASKTFCARVNNLPCSVSTTSVNTNIPTFTGTGNKTTTVANVPSVRKGKALAFSVLSRITGYSIPKGAKVSLDVAGQSRPYCAVVKKSVKGLKPGNCKISVQVTPKPSAENTRPAISRFVIRMKVTK